MGLVDGILLVAMMIGALAGGYAFARDPKSYIAFGKELFTAILPFLEKRNTLEIEEKQREASRQGQEWDNFNKTPRERNK